MIDAGSASVSELGKLRILLAEDNVINQRLAVGVLEKHGHHVTTVKDGREALDLSMQQEFDVLLMDIQMPIMDGIDATRAIRAREARSGRHLPIIAMTAHAMKGDREKCLSVGMDEYVAKPIRVGMVLEKLAAVLGLAADKAASSEPANIEIANSETVEAQQSPNSGLDHPIDDACESGSGSEIGKAATLAHGAEELRSKAASTKGKSPLPQPVDGEAICWSQARQAVGGDEELLRDLLRVYLGESNCLLQSVQRAIEQNDRDEILRAVHTYKGASLSVGAIHAHQLAREMEDALLAGDLQYPQQIYQRLRHASDHVVADAEVYLATEH